METNKQTAEEYLHLNSEIFSDTDGESIEAMTIADTKEYGKLCVEEYKSSLRNQDAEEHIDEQSYCDSTDGTPENERIFIDIDDAKHALSIQAAKHQKEIEELKEKAEEVFKTFIGKSVLDGIFTSKLSEIRIEQFKQQLNSK